MNKESAATRRLCSASTSYCVSIPFVLKARGGGRVICKAHQATLTAYQVSFA